MVIPSANEHAIDFIEKLLRIDPNQRWTAEEALRQDFYFRPNLGSTKTEKQVSSFSPVPSIYHDDVASFTTPMTKLNTGTLYDTFSNNNNERTPWANAKRPYVTISPKARPGMNAPRTTSFYSKRVKRTFLDDDLREGI